MSEKEGQNKRIKGEKEKLIGYCGLYCGDCWQCEAFTTCTKLDFLKAGHGDAHIKNLGKLKRNGLTAFVIGKRHWHTAAKNG